MSAVGGARGLGPLAALALFGIACSSPTPPRPPLPDAATPVRRKVKPAPDELRAYPPHAIREGAVGPFQLGAPLGDVLHELPEGPRVELFQLDLLFRWRVVRVEPNALLVGADDRNRVSFIAVIGREIARTQGGLGVGSTAEELLAALGTERALGIATERRELEFESLPGVRFITDAPTDAPPERAVVTAVVIQPPRTSPVRPGAGGCAAFAGARDAVLEAARVARPAFVRVGCFAPDSPGAAVLAGGQLVLVGGEPEHPRRLHSLDVEPADLLLVLDLDGDGVAELIAGNHRQDPRRRTFDLRVYRWDGQRLVESLRQRLLTLSEEGTRSVGVPPGGIELLLEFAPAPGGVSVGGLFRGRPGGGAPILVPLSPMVVRVPGRKLLGAVPPAALADPAARDGGLAPPGDGVGDHRRPSPRR